MSSSNSSSFYDLIPTSLKPLIEEKVRHYESLSPVSTYTVKTYVARPSSNTGKILRWGPDDQTYMNHKELISLLPRGCSDLYMNGSLIVSLRGLPKFDGTSAIDEDDVPFQGATEQDLVHRASLIDATLLQSWNDQKELETQIIEKANGKFAIAMLFQHPSSQIWCLFGGSKNVHVVIPLFNDENDEKNAMNKSKREHEASTKQKSESLLHFMILHRMAEDIRRYCSSNRSSSTDSCCALLEKKALLAEYVDGKHLIYVDTLQLVYFDTSLPSCFTTLSSETMVGMPNKELLRAIRKKEESEGVVLVYKNTRTGQVIRQKHKTEWYVILRSFRELLCSLSTPHFRIVKDGSSKLIALLVKRLYERSHGYLELDATAIQLWIDRIERFVPWILASKYGLEDVGFSSPIGMAFIWREFYQATY
ncbi:MAG: hypothetical protein Sylvanvirus3_12 [Sylvanvirus sp.]|uniref:Uncharacterized protein n=1 Tax=Sylvanvirus sp. TaxID=2487774 RepID=A0A3G5AHE2_9VIRU|nr:MAG: hypothetical protein Sylvanvirus3_12 [Sylvanvirus sp.]